MMNKKILYFDMDGVLVNFDSGIARLTKAEIEEYGDDYGSIPGIFGRMDPYDGALEFVNILAEDFDVYILSTVPYDNPIAAYEKLLFIGKHFGDVFHKRVVFSHNKHLNMGDFLIDDRTKHGAGEFTGEHIHFGTDKFPDYRTVIDYLKERS